MTIIKTILEGLIIVALIVLSIFLSSVIAKSKLSLSFFDFNFQDIKMAVICLNLGVLGSYWYLFKNIWIEFKSKIVLGIFVTFCFIQLGSSAYLIKWGKELKPKIETTFNEIAFPTEPDIVKKNIKLSIIKHAEYMHISFVLMAITGIVAGIYKWNKLQKIK